MTNTDQTLPPNATPPTRGNVGGRVIRWVVLGILSALVTILLILAIMASTDRGSRILLEWFMDRQGYVTYRYQSGSILSGMTLTDIHLKVKMTEVLVNRARVRPGWRGLFKRQLHFITADVDTLTLIDHKPPSDEPFKFQELKLPIAFVLDDASIQKVKIQTPKAKINLYNLTLKGAEWSGTKIQFVHSTLRTDFFSAEATGHIELYQKYPVNITAVAHIPMLNGLNMQRFSAAVHGDIDTLKIGVASATPDILAGYLIVHPVRKNLPLQGKFSWVDFHVPFATQQQLFSKAGTVLLSGNLKAANATVIADLSGKNIPYGNYQIAAETDFKQLTLTQLVGRVLGGQLNMAGQVTWQDGIRLALNGHMRNFDPVDPMIPATIRPFLPPNLDGSLALQGEMLTSDQKRDIRVNADLNFDRFEKFNIQAVQSIPVVVTAQDRTVIAGNDVTPTVPVADLKSKNDLASFLKPWQVTLSWREINRALPYVGWLTSRQGQVQTVIDPSRNTQSGWFNDQYAQLDTVIDGHAQSLVPEGRYQAQVMLRGRDLLLKQFQISQHGKWRAQAQGTVQLPLVQVAQSQPVTTAGGVVPSDGNTRIIAPQPAVVTRAMPRLVIDRNRPLTVNAQVQTRDFVLPIFKGKVALKPLTAHIDVNAVQQGNGIVINRLQLTQAGNSQVAVQGSARLPLIDASGNRQPLAINAQVKLNNFNPQQLSEQIPINALTANMNINARQQGNQVMLDRFQMTQQGRSSILAQGTAQLPRVDQAGRQHPLAVDAQVNLNNFDAQLLNRNIPLNPVTAQMRIKAQQQGNQVRLNQFEMTQKGNSSVSMQAVAQLPLNRQPLKLNAQVKTRNFNPQQLNNKIPLTDLTGALSINAYQTGDQYIAQVQNLDLNAKLLSDASIPRVRLTGQSTAAVLLNADRKSLKSFALNYNGQFNAQGSGQTYTQGPLRVALSGTPKLLKISELYHNGAAGMVNAKGQVNLTQGAQWNVQAQLKNFKPHYFVSTIPGNLSGHVDSQGQWSARRKNVLLDNVDLNGTLKGKALSVQGDLAVDLAGISAQNLKKNSPHNN